MRCLFMVFQRLRIAPDLKRMKWFILLVDWYRSYRRFPSSARVGAVVERTRATDRPHRLPAHE